jgi:hypothetical protein
MGHTARTGGGGAVMPTVFLIGKGNGKRPLGRPGRRREDDIKMDLK